MTLQDVDATQIGSSFRNVCLPETNDAAVSGNPLLRPSADFWHLIRLFPRRHQRRRRSIKQILLPEAAAAEGSTTTTLDNQGHVAYMHANFTLRNVVSSNKMAKFLSRMGAPMRTRLRANS